MLFNILADQVTSRTIPEERKSQTLEAPWIQKLNRQTHASHSPVLVFNDLQSIIHNVKYIQSKGINSRLYENKCFHHFRKHWFPIQLECAKNEDKISSEGISHTILLYTPVSADLATAEAEPSQQCRGLRVPKVCETRPKR